MSAYYTIGYRGSVTKKLSHTGIDNNFKTLNAVKIPVSEPTGAAIIPYNIGYDFNPRPPMPNIFYDSPNSLLFCRVLFEAPEPIEYIPKRGPQGEEGYSDPTTGFKGSMGATGETGPMGIGGLNGVKGPTGPKGATGATGPTGPNSNQQGNQGPAGSNGNQGAQGSQGYKGSRGPTAVIGSTHLQQNYSNSYISYNTVGGSSSSSFPGHAANVLGVNVTQYNTIFLRSTSNAPALQLYGNGTQLYMTRSTSNTSGNVSIITMTMSGNNLTISSPSGTIAYGTGSDYRIKENIVERSDGELDNINKIKIYSFNRIHSYNPHKEYGVLAHELQEIYPEAVRGEKDAVDENNNIKIQKVNYAYLLPRILVSLKELTKQVEELENK